eukprot:jgi/Mesvir1/22038/Mv18604-RA.1
MSGFLWFDEHPLSNTNWVDTFTIPKWDPYFGPLTGVTIYLYGLVQGSMAYESLDPTDGIVVVTLRAFITVDGFSGRRNIIVVPAVTRTEFATAVDGSIDFNGGAGSTFDDVRGNATNVTLIADSASLEQFVGIGELNLRVIANAASTASGTGNIITSFRTRAYASISVVYECNGAAILTTSAIPITVTLPTPLANPAIPACFPTLSPIVSILSHGAIAAFGPTQRPCPTSLPIPITAAAGSSLTTTFASTNPYTTLPTTLPTKVPCTAWCFFAPLLSPVPSAFTVPPRIYPTAFNVAAISAYFSAASYSAATRSYPSQSSLLASSQLPTESPDPSPRTYHPLAGRNSSSPSKPSASFHAIIAASATIAPSTCLHPFPGTSLPSSASAVTATIACSASHLFPVPSSHTSHPSVPATALPPTAKFPTTAATILLAAATIPFAAVAPTPA